VSIEPIHQIREQGSLPAIEVAIFAGIPINVTLLFRAAYWLPRSVPARISVASKPG